jgi:hypothetical protein
VIVRYLFAAASFLLLASSCETSKAPRAPAPGSVQQASPAPPHASTGDAEADYLAAKYAYLASFAADAKRGVPDSISGPREALALRDLADRLRTILGPFHGEGLAGPGTSNITTVYPQMDVDNLDGMVYQSSDSLTVLVTTRTLLAAWLRSPVAPADSMLPRDPMTALARSEVYAVAFPEDAAVMRYADIPVDHAAESGVVAAMLVLRAQDIGPFTPNDVMVSVMRGNRLYFAEQPARVIIAPMPSCVAMWNAGKGKQDSLIEAGRSNLNDSTARDASWRMADQAEEHADSVYRQCYAEHVPTDARFAQLTQQVASIVRRLPP